MVLINQEIPEQKVQSHIKICSTCGIFEHHLSFLDLQGDEVVFLIEASIIEEKTSVLQGGKTRKYTHTETHVNMQSCIYTVYFCTCLHPENTVQINDVILWHNHTFSDEILNNKRMAPASLLICYLWKKKGYSICTKVLNHIGAGFHTPSSCSQSYNSLFSTARPRGRDEAKAAMLTLPDQKNCFFFFDTTAQMTNLPSWQQDADWFTLEKMSTFKNAFIMPP